MRQEKYPEAIKTFNIIIQEFPYAQAWDPRGWYWRIAKAAQDSIDKIKRRLAPPSEEEAGEAPAEKILTTVRLFDPGSEDIVDYTKYGKFKNIGTKYYKYVIRDQSGLSKAVGEGIYPNTTSIRRDPRFKAALKEGRLEGSPWDFLHSSDLEAAFFKWATASEPPGVKLFYTGLILEKAGLIKHAIKCYYAIVVHFPGSYGWTYWHTPWYVAQAAVAKINFLLRENPDIKYRLRGAHIKIINGYDNDVSNDIVIAHPGRWVPKSQVAQRKAQIAKDRKLKKIIGDGKVRLFQYQGGSWQLMMDGSPYIIKGITYAPTKVGQSPDEGTLGNWMFEDFNNNGKIDGPYDTFVDKNGNNLQEEDEPEVGDFKLMQEMGVNTIRVYHHPNKVNKKLLRDLYENYGIMVIMGDFLGKYALGSGASWYEGTDYRNPEHQKNMIASVKQMVEEFKDEPYILFWLLGNENVYGVACNADKDPEGFFKFANEVACIIKSLDPEHPVALCNGDTLFLDVFGKYCPDIDIFGANAYRGNYGFGYLWQAVKEEADKPAFITEFGCPAYAEGKTREEAEELQAEYHRAAWEDIQYNMSDGPGVGNAIGGIIFEWLDEWWKAYEPGMHDTKPLWAGPFPDGYMHEEWLGLCGQGDGSQSPFLRQLRKAYYAYQEMWR
jgi:beta-glucuronidase